MVRLRPGWLVVLFAAVIAVSGWLPWRTTSAEGGGHSSAIGGSLGSYFSPPPKFDAGQLVVLLASALVVAGAMTARELSERMSAVAALLISLSIGGLTVVYYQQKVHPPVVAGYGLYVGAAATVVAAVCSVWALVSALSSARAPR